MPEQLLSIYLSYLSHGRVFCKDFFFFLAWTINGKGKSETKAKQREGPAMSSTRH